MILGIGTDLVKISRIARVLERFPKRFPHKLLTLTEQQYCGDDPRKIAKRFALKEAVLKALGTGMSQGISWHNIETNHLPSGQPVIQLSGMALHLAQQKTPPGWAPYVHGSVTDDEDWAQAFVILSIISA